MKNLVTIALLFVVAAVSGQGHEEHEGHYHEHHKNEIGVANAPVYFVKEKTFTYGLHFHYVRTIADSKFGVGLGYEQIFDDHEHKTFGLVASYRFLESMSITMSPGITSEKSGDYNFALHIETTYEWEWGNFHLGPVAEIAYDPEDYHLSLGLHLGYGF